MPDILIIRYSALAACIAQDRAPRPDELDRVAARVMQEGFATRVARDVVTRRLAIRVARTALLGGGSTG